MGYMAEAGALMVDLTREQMLERLIEAQFNSMDLRNLFQYFQTEQERYYADASTEFIESEYIEFFGDDDDG